jgi:predicted amidophosphoribosyltransferase
MLARLAGRIQAAGRFTLDLLLPPQCVTCDATVDAPGRFCAACFAATGFVTEPCCRRCGVPFELAADGGPDLTCGHCRAAPPLFGRARGALRYDAQARRLVLPLKHGDRVEHAAALAPLMLRAGGALVREADLLVPVPLHRRRLIARRYNQAVLLARAVGRLAGRPVLPDALQRVRATAPLGSLSAAARAREVGGAFAVRPGREAALARRRVLLVDDVMTSGATASACALALIAAGVAAVDVLVAARVPDPRRR